MNLTSFLNHPLFLVHRLIQLFPIEIKCEPQSHLKFLVAHFNIYIMDIPKIPFKIEINMQIIEILYFYIVFHNLLCIFHYYYLNFDYSHFECSVAT